MKPESLDKFPSGTGTGASADLSLRVSLATLVRLQFRHPGDGKLWLALERKATLFKSEDRNTVDVKCQPFGGAIQIRDLSKLRELIGDFRFDSERSRSERDFRIYIKPSNWEAVRDTCLEHFSQPNDPILESDPARELNEELADSLKVLVRSDQYTCKPFATLVEDHPKPTSNIHARGSFTARIYRVFEANITDSSLVDRLLINNNSISNQDLVAFTLADAQAGGMGRANAVLALPLEEVCQAYLAQSLEERSALVVLDGNRLDMTVAAILDGIQAPFYRLIL